MSYDANYDDYNDFHDDEEVYEMDGVECGREDGFEDDEMDSTYDDYYDDSMDGDHDSAMESAGWGTDEDYGYYGDDTPMYDDYYGGE